ncbi:hypothetical protein PHMEG_00022511, partial [Phytophthora megakarya]
RIAGIFGIEDIMHAINREEQTQTWNNALQALCDFVRVRGHGIRFTCTNRDLAIKLGGTAVNCMDERLIIKPYSAYERFYYVDLTRIPSNLDEDVIYDYFASLGLQPVISPTHMIGTLMSRDRTVWFPHTDVPDALMNGDQPLREIFFKGFPDSPVYVQHKKRVLNKVVPPSIQAKRDETERLKEEAAAKRRHKKKEQRDHDPDQAKENPPSTNPDEAPTTTNLPTQQSMSPLDSVHPEGVIILERPTATAPAQAWVKISRHALCSKTPPNAPGEGIKVTQSNDEDGRLVFGFPVKPTSFELAFTDHDLDEATAGDADCEAFTEESKAIHASPVTLSESAGRVVVARSFLEPKTNTIKRSEYRRRARKAAKELHTFGEPDDRLAAITAQPSAYAPVVYANPPELANVVDEHAVLRLYSGKPSTTHGTNCTLMQRVIRDYPGGNTSPSASEILTDCIPDDTYRAMERAHARMDLFLRTHAPAIYHDPVKVQALCGNMPAYEHFFSDSLSVSWQLVLESQNDQISMNSSGSETNASDEAHPSDDESVDSKESSEQAHL